MDDLRIVRQEKVEEIGRAIFLAVEVMMRQRSPFGGKCSRELGNVRGKEIKILGVETGLRVPLLKPRRKIGFFYVGSDLFFETFRDELKHLVPRAGLSTFG